MRISFVAGAVPMVVLAIACSKDPPPPATPIAPGGTATAPAGTAYPSGYQQPGYQQPGYQPTPSASAPAAGQMATPGPTALACQNDSQCMTHRCNTQYGKCAFPCQSAADCIPPNQCLAGLCVPTPPQSH